MRKEFTIAEADAGQRLDRWLAGHLSEVSRSEIKRWIEAGNVLLDGKSTKPSTPLAIGAEIVVEISDEPKELKASKVPLKIIYEDDDVIVVDKQIGLVVHPGADHQEGTLVQGLLFLEKQLAHSENPQRPGVVHRLDKETSGVIILAKSEAAYQGLIGQFHDRLVKKSYLALVQGIFQEGAGRIEAEIGRDLRHQPRMKVRLRGGKSAITDFEVLKSFDDLNLTLLLVKPLTGRTHQIRVHLAAIDHWVVGDRIYGKPKSDPGNTSRLMLHAWRLRLSHPCTGEELEFTSAPPAEFASYMGGVSLPESDSLL